MSLWSLVLLQLISLQNTYVHSNLIRSTISQTQPSDALTISLPNEHSKINSNTDPTTWILQSPPKPYSHALHLQSSSKSLTFTSKQSCFLNITIDGIQKPKNGAIFYVFSIGASFISFAHDFDGNLVINGEKGIFIYPKCHSNLAQIAPNTKITTLYHAIHGSKSLRQKLSQTATDSLSTQWTQLQAPAANPDLTVHFPIHLTIKNYYLQSKATFQFTDNRHIDIQCEYNNAFPLNHPFNLFMSTDIARTSRPAVEISQFAVSADCECDKKIKYLDWSDRDKVYHKYNIYVNATAPSVTINVYLSYLADSNLYSLHIGGCAIQRHAAETCTSHMAYRAYFTWHDLLFNCREDSDINIVNTLKWINLTGIISVDMVHASDSSEYNIAAPTFNIAIAKTLSHEKSHLFDVDAADINIFSMTVAAVYKYKESEKSGYKMILLTECMDYIQLDAVGLLLYPLQLTNIQINAGAISGTYCINKQGAICSQLWEIYVFDDSDLSGIYVLRFGIKCKQNNGDMKGDKYCEEYVGKTVELSSHLSWSDNIFDMEPTVWMIQFYAHFTFSKDITFNTVYNGDSNTVFVRLSVKMPLSEYVISDVLLTNVWICSIDEEKYGSLSVSQLRAIGGCLSPNIDRNGPYHIIENYDKYFYFNAKHIVNVDDDNNLLRFSFNIPTAMKRDKLFIHTQVRLGLVEIESQKKENQIRHFGASINIKNNIEKEKEIIINNLTIFGGYEMDKVVILLIISLVVCVICMNIFVVASNNKKNQKKYQSQSELYDTETTAMTTNESMSSHKKLYDLIHGLYTSHDESKDIKKRNSKRTIKPKKKIKMDKINKIANEIEIKIERKEREKKNEDQNVNRLQDEDEKEVDTQKINRLHPRFEPFIKNETDFTTDIQTLDELTSCTDLSDVDSKKNKRHLQPIQISQRMKPKIKHNQCIAKMKPIVMEKDRKEEEEENEIKEKEFTYTSETDKEKRERVKLIKQMIEDTDIEDAECTQYSDEYEHDQDD